ncbi:hypothetical protein [Methanogenium organophilum]|uniref:Uncharacterized protein n=1 Tax=Methanogenium organophilum TaxID=2199 RepID=A0A9X9T9A8_METOG|nr:hypothetical protein [Methanogenium organophilum]WAI02216.1 hypothetical protein OU421_04905 [Methanogenium organophilum]
MNHADMTMGQFFSEQEKESFLKRLSDPKKSREMNSLQKTVASKSRLIPRSMISDGVREETRELLKSSVKDIIIHAWKTAERLQKYRDRETYPPDEVHVVTVGGYTIHSTQNPRIEVLLNGGHLDYVDFTVDIALVFEGAVLEIKDAKIISIKTGSCKGTCTISCEDVVLPGKETESVELPGKIDLGDGIPIGE